MADTDMVFCFVFPTDVDCDMRTFRVYQVIRTTAHEELEFYRVRQNDTHQSLVMNASHAAVLTFDDCIRLT